MRRTPNDQLKAGRKNQLPQAGDDAALARSPGSGRTAPHGEGERDPPERTCILTRAKASPDALIRLALAPDGSVAPDIRARAPGRGAWIGVDRPALAKAIANGKLKAALARTLKAPVVVPADLADRTGQALRQAALDRLGLEARAGTLVTGGERIETEARAGNVHLLIHAADAGADGSRRLDQALRVGNGDEASGAKGLVFPEERTILSLALGRQNVVHIAVIDRAAAARVRRAVDRWRAFIGPDEGLIAAPAESPDASACEDK